jgi:hypothetical protein
LAPQRLRRLRHDAAEQQPQEQQSAADEHVDPPDILVQRLLEAVVRDVELGDAGRLGVAGERDRLGQQDLPAPVDALERRRDAAGLDDRGVDLAVERHQRAGLELVAASDLGRVGRPHDEAVGAVGPHVRDHVGVDVVAEHALQRRRLLRGVARLVVLGRGEEVDHRLRGRRGDVGRRGQEAVLEHLLEAVGEHDAEQQERDRTDEQHLVLQPEPRRSDPPHVDTSTGGARQVSAVGVRWGVPGGTPVRTSSASVSRRSRRRRARSPARAAGGTAR